VERKRPYQGRYAPMLLAANADKLATAVWLDTDNTKALSLTAYTLCRHSLNHCKAGRKLHQMIIDEAKKRRQTGIGSGWYLYSEDVEKRDIHTFLSARATGQLDTAPLSAVSHGNWSVDDITEQQYIDQLNELASLKSTRFNQKQATQWRDTTRKLYSLVLDQFQAERRARNRLELAPIPYFHPQVENNRHFEKARNVLHSELLETYPVAYRILLLQYFNRVSHGRNAEIKLAIATEAHDAYVFLIDAAKNQRLFRELDKFLISSFDDNHSLLNNQQKISVIKAFQKRHAVRSNNPLNEAMFLQKNKSKHSAINILQRHNLTEVTIYPIDNKNIAGTYKLKHSDKKYLTFVHTEKPHRILTYRPITIDGQFISNYNRWRLKFNHSSSMRFNGKVLREHGNRLAFVQADGNHIDQSIAEQSLLDPTPSTIVTPNTNGSIETQRIAGVPLRKSTSKTLSTRQLLATGMVVDIHKQWAIVGNYWSDEIGRITAEVIPNSRGLGRRNSLLIDALFDGGHINAVGFPIETRLRDFNQRVANDLTRFTETEVSRIQMAAKKIWSLNSTGKVEIYKSTGTDAWVKHSSLSSPNPIKEQRFGVRVKIFNKYAFVCDAFSQLHIYSRVDESWRYRQSTDTNCSALAVSDNWVATGAAGEVEILSYGHFGLRSLQKIKSLEQKHRCADDRGSSSTLFGSALATYDNKLMVWGENQCAMIYDITHSNATLSRVLALPEIESRHVDMRTIGERLVVADDDIFLVYKLDSNNITLEHRVTHDTNINYAPLHHAIEKRGNGQATLYFSPSSRTSYAYSFQTE